MAVGCFHEYAPDAPAVELKTFFFLIRPAHRYSVPITEIRSGRRGTCCMAGPFGACLVGSPGPAADQSLRLGFCILAPAGRRPRLRLLPRLGHGSPDARFAQYWPRRLQGSRAGYGTSARPFSLPRNASMAGHYVLLLAEASPKKDTVSPKFCGAECDERPYLYFQGCFAWNTWTTETSN
jgi:hypothetical protein